MVSDATATAAAVSRGLDKEQDAAVAAVVSAALAASAQLPGTATAGTDSADGAGTNVLAAAGGAGELEVTKTQDNVNSHLLLTNVNSLNKLWQNAAQPPSSQDVENISAQVSWLQEFCDHLVENSLSRSLHQQKQPSGPRKRESAKRKREASAKQGQEEQEGLEEAAVGEADSMELCGAFEQESLSPIPPLARHSPLAPPTTHHSPSRTTHHSGRGWPTYSYGRAALLGDAGGAHKWAWARPQADRWYAARRSERWKLRRQLRGASSDDAGMGSPLAPR